MKVFVKTLKGSNFPIEVKQEDTVRYLVFSIWYPMVENFLFLRLFYGDLIRFLSYLGFRNRVSTRVSFFLLKFGVLSIIVSVLVCSIVYFLIFEKIVIHFFFFSWICFFRFDSNLIGYIHTCLLFYVYFM